MGPDLCPRRDHRRLHPTSLMSPICLAAILLGGGDRFGFGATAQIILYTSLPLLLSLANPLLQPSVFLPCSLATLLHSVCVCFMYSRWIFLFSSLFNPVPSAWYSASYLLAYWISRCFMLIFIYILYLIVISGRNIPGYWLKTSEKKKEQNHPVKLSSIYNICKNAKISP